jgi:hypothetical protein
MSAAAVPAAPPCQAKTAAVVAAAAAAAAAILLSRMRRVHATLYELREQMLVPHAYSVLLNDCPMRSLLLMHLYSHRDCFAAAKVVPVSTGW